MSIFDSKKRKVVVILGYCGKNYCGMQVNPGVETIESILFSKFCKIGCVSENNSVDLKKVGWMRSCRTDKGVHASVQVLSAKLIVDNKEKKIEQINKELPEDIIVFDIIRCTNTFNAKKECISRTYEYLLPTCILSSMERSSFFDMETFEESLNKEFRMTFGIENKLKEFLSFYIGTKNYNNFTIKKEYSDPSAMRYITDFSVGEKIVFEGIEWISLRVTGQSFMLNQIRKMIGLCILSIVFGIKEWKFILEDAMGKEKINIPKAPACGLLLLEPFFSSYNKRIMEREDLLPVCLSSEVKEKVSYFKKNSIYKEIINEKSLNEFMCWFKCLHENRNDFLYFKKYY